MVQRVDPRRQVLEIAKQEESISRPTSSRSPWKLLHCGAIASGRDSPWYSFHQGGHPVIFGITATYHRQFPSLRIVWRCSWRSFNRSWQFDLRTNLCEMRREGDDIPVPLGKRGKSPTPMLPPPSWLKIQRRQSSVDQRWKRTIRAHVSFRSGKAICKLSPAGHRLWRSIKS